MRLIGISLTNFQRHEKLKFAFDEGITSIVGESNAGKSAVVRALRWVLYNDIRGHSFIRQGADECKVNIKFQGTDDSTHIVGRRRTRGNVNEYTLNGKVLKGFKNDVPEQIQSLTGVSALNVQVQAEPHFWVNLSPAELSRKMNEVVEIDAFDRFTKEASRIRSESDSQIKSINARRQELREQKSAIQQDLRRIKFFEVLREARQAVHQRQEDVDDLLEIIEKLEGLEEEIHVPDLRPLEDLNQTRAELARSCEELSDLIKTIEDSNASIQEYEDQLRILNQQIGKIKVCPTCGKQM